MQSLMKCSIVRHFIWVCTVSLSTCLGISRLQRVPLVLFELSLFSEYSGPPDPLHGNTPYVMVRKNAQVCLFSSLLYTQHQKLSTTQTYFSLTVFMYDLFQNNNKFAKYCYPCISLVSKTCQNAICYCQNATLTNFINITSINSY